jgi:drug/metabolite transporter (DMT)-like permease
MPALVPATFVLLWSSGALFAELGLRWAKPLTFLSLRLLAATALLWPVILWLRPGLPTTRTELGRIVGTGLLLQVGYQTLFFLALFNKTSPGLLAIILGVQPILTPWIAREPTTNRERLGLALGLAGLCLVVANTLAVGAVSAAGVTSAIGSLGGITVGTVRQQQIHTGLLATTAIQYTASALILTLLAVTLESYQVTWSASFGLALAWMVLVVSVAATLLLYAMIRHTKLTHVASLFYLVPPVTAGLDYLVFGHTLTNLTILGMAMVVTALVLITRRTPTMR